MHTLTIEDTQRISGSNFSELGAMIFGAGGVYYGAGIGFSVATIPAVLIAMGLVGCGVSLPVSLGAGAVTVGIGAVGGGYWGAKFGSALGTMVGQAVDKD